MTESLPNVPLLRVIVFVCREAGDPLEVECPPEVNMLPRDWMETRFEACARFFRWSRQRKRRIIWIRPFLRIPEGEDCLHFPWTDTWRETESILRELASGRDELVYSDADQGWDVDIRRRGDRLIIRAGDLENPADDRHYDLYAKPYADLAREELDRAPALFRRLAVAAWPNPIMRFLKSPF
ncbi:MAG: hypothetical protein K1X53_07955 [Candidatus Sumerlaeaceae bacterium]|nr:hypothetical protein [Candidatus Sumerlaeaceae bacterium]